MIGPPGVTAAAAAAAEWHLRNQRLEHQVKRNNPRTKEGEEGGQLNTPQTPPEKTTIQTPPRSNGAAGVHSCGILRRLEWRWGVVSYG